MSMDPQPSTLTWRCHPARERPGSAILGGLIILGLAGAAWISFGVAWAVVAIVVLVFSLNRFCFPSRFEMDDDGITARYALKRQRMRWHDVRRFLHDGRGGYLSTRSRRSFLDSYSGMHVLFAMQSPGDREQVVACIQQRVDSATTAGEAKLVESESIAGATSWPG